MTARTPRPLAPRPLSARVHARPGRLALPATRPDLRVDRTEAATYALLVRGAR